jgi:hypothetical protein
MISYTDFDFAIARWKARVGGAPQPATEPPSGAVQAEVPVATAPESPAGAEPDAATLAEEAPSMDSGLVVSESLPELPENPPPDSEEPK